jgi:hypothetical protein
MTKFAVAILLALRCQRVRRIHTAQISSYQDVRVSLIVRTRPLQVEVFRQGVCAGSVDGLGYGISGKETCPPKEVTGGQVGAVVVKYIEARPERMHEHFGDLALEALTAAWPCKR